MSYLLNENETRLNSLAPCFMDVLNNKNISYARHDLSYNNDLTKLVNTDKTATHSKLGLFLKSLNRNALNKNANKDVWCVEVKSMWLDCCDSSKTMQDGSDKMSFIRNTSFKLWLVNVHEFYNCQMGIEAIGGRRQDQVEAKNFDQIYARLSKVIQIDAGKAPPPVMKEKRSASLTATNLNPHCLYRQSFAKLNLIGEINELNVSCTHEQIVFLLRLLETFDAFNTQLELDSEHTLNYNKTCSKDNNNNTKKKPTPFDLKQMCDEYSDDVDADNQAQLNVSLVINSIEINLELNNYNCKSNRQPTCQADCLNTTTKAADRESLFDASDLNVSLNDSLRSGSIRKEDFELISRQLDQEFMCGYLKFIYGLSMDNPTQRLSFSSVAALDEHLVTARGMDLLGAHIDIPNSVRHASFGALNANTMAVSFSAVSSTVSSSTNALTKTTASFFNKPLSNLNNVIKNVKNQGDGMFEGGEFLDDNDSISALIQLEQDDTSSVASLSMDSKNLSASSMQLNVNMHQYQSQASSFSLKSSSSSSDIGNLYSNLSKFIYFMTKRYLNQLLSK